MNTAFASFCGLVLGGTALLPAEAQAHTDALGFLLTNGSTTGLYNVEIFYGSWHVNGVAAAEGALDLSNSTPTLIGTHTFALVLGPVSAGVVPAGLVAGTNYFFPNTATATQGDLTGVATGHPIYYFQSTTFLDLTPGSYTFGYNTGSSFTVNWEPSDTAINNGSFIIAADGTLGGVGGAGPVTHNIDSAAPTYSSSNLATVVNPAFEGGVLLINEVGATYSQNFSLDDSGSNRIDMAGNSSTFSGVLRDTTSGEPGGIIFNNSVGGSVATLTGVNVHTGGTTINAGTVLLAGAGRLGSDDGATTVTGGTLNFGGTTQAQAALNQSGGTVMNGAIGVTDYQLTGGTLAATVVVTADTALDMQAGTVNGVLAGDAALTKTGTGTVTLTAANSYAGGSTVTAGNLDITGSGTLGATGSATSISGGRLDLGGTTQSQSALSQSGGLVQNGAIGVTSYELDGGVLGATATVTASGSFDLRAGAADGVLAGSADLAKSDVGAVTLSAINTYTGATLISGGTLSLAGAGSIGQSSGVANDGTLDISATTTGAVITDITGSGTVELGARRLTLTAATGSYDGGIDGSGGITLLGGLKTLGGVSTYTGDTTVAGGELRVNNRLGVTAVTVQSGASLSGTGEIEGSVLVLSGGTLAAGQSPGTLELGSLTLNAGSTSVFELGAPGVVGGPLNDLIIVNGALTLGGALDATVASVGQYRLFNAGSVSGTFAAVALTAPTVPGAGWLVYTNESGGGAAVEVNLGVFGAGQTLQFWDGADSLGNGAVDGGSGVWNSSFTNWTGPPAQAGVNAGTDNSIAIFQAAPGTVTVVGTQGFDSLVFNTHGYVLTAGAGGALALNNEGVIDVDAGTATLALPLGNGTQSVLTKEGSGSLILTGDNTWSGGTRLDAGTLQVGNGGTTGSLPGDVANSGTLAFNRSDDVVFAGNITGSGGVLQRGTGVTTLRASNGYTGGTVISTGVLAGTAASFGTGPIVNDAVLVIDQPDAAIVDNAIQGTGTFTKRGAGTLTYTGSGDLTGPTGVESGTLAISGFLGASPVTVDDGATLTGGGTVGGLLVRSGAALDTGNDGAGTLTVDGPVTQEAGSTWLLQVGSAGEGDALVATGAAAVAEGAVLQVSKLDAGRYVLGRRYLVLTAEGGVTGVYTLTGDTRVSAFFDVVGAYDDSHAWLDVVQTRSFTAAGDTGNRRATAGGIDELGLGNALFTAMGYLQSDAEVGAALDQVSGELHASAQAAAIEDSRFVREAAFSRVRAAFGDAAAAGASELSQANTDARAVWGQAFGSWGRSDGGDAAQLDRSTGGFFLGTDAPLAEGVRVGLLGGYSRADMHAAARASRGTSDNYHVALYGGSERGALGLRLGAAYTIHKLDTSRSPAFEGYSDNLRASYAAQTAQVFGDLGWRFDTARVALEPYATVAYVSLHTDALSERGGPAALQARSEKLAVPFSTVGVRASGSRMRDSAVGITLHATLGWRHAYDRVLPVSRINFAGGDSFAIAGVPIARDVAVMDLGLAGALARGMTLQVGYSGQAGDGLVDHGVKALFRWAF